MHRSSVPASPQGFPEFRSRNESSLPDRRDVINAFVTVFGIAALERTGIRSLQANEPNATHPVYSADDVHAMLSDPTRVQVTTVKEATKNGVPCVEDRDTKPGLGIPGGSLGSAAIAIDAGEDIARTHMTPDDIREVVYASAGFEFHTDKGTLHRVAMILKDKGVRDAAHLLHIVKSGSNNAKLDAAVQEVLTSIFEGCGYTNLTHNQADLFGMRPGVTKGIVTAGVERARRSKSGVNIEVVEGTHNAGAVVDVDPGMLTSEADLVPLIRHCAKTGNLFVLCTALARLEVARLLPTVMKVLPGARGGRLKDAVEERMTHHAKTTALALAKGLPYDVAHFHPNADLAKAFTIEQKGLVRDLYKD